MSAAKHFHVAGWVPCSDYVQSKNAITGIATLFPNNVSAKIYECKKMLSVNRCLTSVNKLMNTLNPTSL
jgi:hypothetical protein